MAIDLKTIIAFNAVSNFPTVRQMLEMMKERERRRTLRMGARQTHSDWDPNTNMAEIFHLLDNREKILMRQAWNECCQPQLTNDALLPFCRLQVMMHAIDEFREEHVNDQDIERKYLCQDLAKELGRVCLNNNLKLFKAREIR